MEGRTLHLLKQVVAHQPHRQDWRRLVAYCSARQRREHVHFVTMHAVRHQLVIEAVLELNLTFELPRKTRRMWQNVLLPWRLRLHLLLLHWMRMHLLVHEGGGGHKALLRWQNGSWRVFDLGGLHLRAQSVRSNITDWKAHWLTNIILACWLVIHVQHCLVQEFALDVLSLLECWWVCGGTLGCTWDGSLAHEWCGMLFWVFKVWHCW